MGVVGFLLMFLFLGLCVWRLVLCSDPRRHVTWRGEAPWMVLVVVGFAIGTVLALVGS